MDIPADELVKLHGDIISYADSADDARYLESILESSNLCGACEGTGCCSYCSSKQCNKCEATGLCRSCGGTGYRSIPDIRHDAE